MNRPLARGGEPCEPPGPMPSGPLPRRALVLLFVLALAWGTNWPLFPMAVREVSVWTFRAVSLPVAGAGLLLFAHLRGQSIAVPRRYWRTIAIATVCYLFVWNIASTYAAVLIPSGQAAVLGFTMPLWAALIGWAVLGERLTPRLRIALGLGTAGVVLLTAPSFGAYANAPLGLAVGLLAAIGWAVGTLVLKRGAIDVPAIVLTGWQLLGVAVPVAIGALVLGDHRWFVPSWTTLAVIGYITVIPMSVGYAVWFAIVGMLPANVAGLSAILVPVVALISGAIVHGEPLGPLQLLGMTGCVTAMWLALFRPTAPQSRKGDFP